MVDLSPQATTFLSTGTRTGMLGYQAQDGRPLVTPIWFLVEHRQLVLNTGANTSKGRALQRDPRTVITVDDPHPPYSFVQVQGTAELIDDDPAALLDVATRIAARYMGADKAESYGRRNAVPGELIVRITPTKVIEAFNIAD